MCFPALLLVALVWTAEDPALKKVDEDNLRRLLRVQRVYVDRLGGGETAGQIRDMLISSLAGTKLFAITDNQERADAVLRGSAEDLVFTDTFQTSEGINARAGVGTGTSSTSKSTTTSTRRPGVSVGVGENESMRIAERKHEASASVRLVNKDGDVLWSTTQESLGAKFRGASADVADRIAKQLQRDYERARKLAAPATSVSAPASGEKSPR
jgi:hypothetical protein